MKILGQIMENYTDHAINQQKEILSNYKNLSRFYDDHMGNFGFNDEDLKKHFGDVMRWLKEHNDYHLLFQDGYGSEEDGEYSPCWWVTESY